MEASSAMERYFSQNQTYAVSTIASVYPAAASPEWKYYILSWGSAAPTATSYTLKATPIDSQVGDECGSFTLNHLSVRDVTGGTLSRQDCWKMN
ncbi:MAG: type IV pilin protein [Methylobacillus sp.]|nr:type IV pilin protein [Methylobacillus sp.]